MEKDIENIEEEKEVKKEVKEEVKKKVGYEFVQVPTQMGLAIREGNNEPVSLEEQTLHNSNEIKRIKEEIGLK